MPATEVLFYKDDDGTVVVLEWLLELQLRNERAFKKCFELIRQLELQGFELRRPRADMLRDGVYELRTRVGNVNYRILYAFVGQNVALLASGLTKEREVPDKEIERALVRIKKFMADPDAHRYVYEPEPEQKEESDGQDE